MNLSHLRAHAREVLPFSILKEGIPRGAITEISGTPGSGKSEFLLRFLAEHASLKTAWIEDQFTAYPCAFPQMGVSLERVLFAEAGAESLWTAQQILRSQLFGAVVLSPQTSLRINEIQLRRLQLAAKQSNAALILLPEYPTIQGAWPISLQIQYFRRPDRFRVIKSPNRTLVQAQHFENQVLQLKRTQSA